MAQPTPFLHDVSILATDFVPDANQADALRAAMIPHRDTLQDLDSNILTLEAELNCIRARRDRLSAQLQANEGLFAPIRRLAPELLGEIFQNVPDERSRGPSIDNVPPLVFVHVCRRWRRVVLGTPRLWTSLDFGNKYNPPSDIVQLWLTCSRSLPLDVRFRLGTDGNDDEYDFDDEYNEYNEPMYHRPPKESVRAVAAHISRCRTLDFGGSSFLEELFPRGSHTRMTFLRSLQITSFNPIRTLGEIEAPVLRELTINCSAKVEALQFTHHLYALQTVVIRGLRLDLTVAQFFAQCPALTTLEICFLCQFDDMPSNFPPISLPSLREMNIKWDVAPTPFLNAIDSPSLNALVLHSDSPGFSPTIFSTFPSSPHALKSLRFCRSSFYRRDFEWFLHKFRNIETLVLEGPAYFEAIMEALASPQNLHSVFPKLSRFHLEGADLSGLETSLTRFVEARAPSSTWQPEGHHLFLLTLQDCSVNTRRGYRILHELSDAYECLVIENLDTWLQEPHV